MKNWTILVFMVPDKRLEDAARKDLEEMEAARVTDDINLAVHIDFAEKPERFAFRGGKAKVVSGVGRQNGLSASLQDFLGWAGTQFQAKQDALILWGHGQGVGTKLSLPALFGSTARPRPKPNRPSRVIEGPATRMPYQIQSTRIASCVLPRHTASPVSPERTSASRALDVSDVAKVLDARGRKLDFLGFDACFMAGIEIAFQLRDAAQLLVASQDFVPDEGWDYLRFLELVALSRDGDARRVAEAIVGHVRDVGGLTNLTLMDLRTCPTLEKLTGALNGHLQRYSEDKARVQLHFETAAYLRLRQLIDLHDLCERLADDFGSTGDPEDERVSEAARETLKDLHHFVLKHEAEGIARKLNGVSVFYQHLRAGSKLADDPSPAEMNVDIDPAEYADLELVQATGWGQLLRRLDPAAAPSGADRVAEPPESAARGPYAAGVASV